MIVMLRVCRFFFVILFRSVRLTRDCRRTRYISRCAVRHMSRCTLPEVASSSSRQRLLLRVAGRSLLATPAPLPPLLPPPPSVKLPITVTTLILWRCSRAVRRRRTSSLRRISTTPPPPPPPLLCHRRRPTISSTVPVVPRRPPSRYTRLAMTCIHMPSTVASRSRRLSRHTGSILVTRPPGIRLPLRLKPSQSPT